MLRQGREATKDLSQGLQYAESEEEAEEIAE